MLNPKLDIENRVPIWCAFQWLYCDIDTVDYYDEIVIACCASNYKVLELEDILFNEVMPALRANLLDVAGVWAGFDKDWLISRILERHRFNKRRPFFFRRYTNSHWNVLKPKIENFKMESAM